MKDILKLLVDNKHKGFFSTDYPVKADTDDEATIYLYDSIVANDLAAELFGGVSPQAFVQTLAQIKTDVIHLRINSPGGDVFAARAMEQSLREHRAKIVAHIDGYAASAAGFLAMAADEVVINEGGFFMIHKAWTMTLGNADDHLHTAALLEQIDASLVETYYKRTKQKPQQIAQWMAEETWMSAQEAVDRGFADRIDLGTKATRAWNMSAYQKAPVLEQQHAVVLEPTVSVVHPTNIDQLRRKLQLVSRTA